MKNLEAQNPEGYHRSLEDYREHLLLRAGRSKEIENFATDHPTFERILKAQTMTELAEIESDLFD